MALFKESSLRSRAQLGRPAFESADSMLTKLSAVASSGPQEFDIFLSHSVLDKEVILGILLSLEDMGYKVYVDWVNDKQLSRDSVSKATAELLRQRMRSSKSLFFATSSNSSNSKWMPWELGFMDGHNKKAAILPISQLDTVEFSGQEYLGVYPYIDSSPAMGPDARNRLWVRHSRTKYVIFEQWLQNVEPTERT